jgi:predicted transposase/invertase (TIGR01784 family)
MTLLITPKLELGQIPINLHYTFVINGLGMRQQRLQHIFKYEERAAYEGHLKWLMIEASAFVKAEAIAREERKKQGKEEVARTMLNKGIQTSIIQELRGLSYEDIKALLPGAKNLS